ncbi:MAG: recombinase family protein [Reichenbachiella sp.]
MKEKCCIYVRVSTIDKQSNSRQVTDLKEYAKSLNLIVDKIFEDKISGVTNVNDRVGFYKLSEYVKSKLIKKVLVWDVTRIGRSTLNMLTVIDEFRNLGISFLTKHEGFDTGSDDPKTNFHISLMSSFAQMEREEIKARVSSGVQNAISNGGTSGYRILPYGFKSANRKLVIDVKESKIIKIIFSLYLEGTGTQKIAHHLNSKGVTTRYNQLYRDKETVKTKHGGTKKPSDFIWRDATVYGILKNPIYIGKRIVRGREYMIDPIISEEIFMEVQKKLKSHSNKINSNRKYLNIFQGDQSKIVCGSCGKTYFMHKRHSGKDNAYKCISKRYEEVNCMNPSIGIDKLNNAVYKSTFDTPFYDFHDDDKNLRKKQLGTQKSILESALEQESQELEELTRQKDKLLDSHLRDVISESDYTKKNEALEKSLTQYARKIKKTKTEMHRTNDLLKTIEVDEFFNYEDVEAFKNNINKYINFIKILDVSDISIVKQLFTNKQDKILLVEVNNLLNGYSVFFIISQREDYYFQVYNEWESNIVNDSEEDSLLIPLGVFNTIKVKNKNDSENQEVEFYADEEYIYDIKKDLEYLDLRKESIGNVIQID